MIGPRFHFTVRSTPLTIGAGDLVAMLVFCWLAIEPATPQGLSRTDQLLVSSTIAAVFFFFGLLMEQAKLAFSRSGDRVGPALLSLLGTVTLTRDETIDESRASRMGRIGFLIDVATAVIFLELALSVYGEPGLLPRAVFVAATLIMGMALLRMCPVQGLDGGQLARWWLTTIFEDEDGIRQAVGGLSIAISMLFMSCGFLVLAQPNHWNVWGLPIMVAGVDCAALSQWISRRARWVRAASVKRVGDLGHSRLPTIKRSAPISELLSIFAVEGQRALVVVTDERGQPTGLIQLRQLRAAVHAGAASHPDDMMITLSSVPRIERETTILDAALYLERTGNLALVVEVAAGKMRVISLDELRRIAD